MADFRERRTVNISVLVGDRWLQAVDSEEPYEIEYRLRRWDGAYRWMLGRALPLYDENRQVTKWFGTCTDIDDLKRTQERLDEAQRIGRIGDWEYEVNSKKINWSPEVHRILGRNLELGPPGNLEENTDLYDPPSIKRISTTVRQTDFVDVVNGVLVRSGLRPDLPELKVTEGVVIPAIDEALQKLRKLHAMGIKLAIDDFGTGYSSLSYLKQLPCTD